MGVVGIGVMRCGNKCISKKCKKKVKCACKCGELKQFSEAIHEACVIDCNGNPGLDHEKWKCENRESIFNQSGVRVCGYSVTETVQWQVEAENQRQREVQANWQKELLFKVLPWIGAVLIGGILYLISRDD